MSCFLILPVIAAPPTNRIQFSLSQILKMNSNCCEIIDNDIEGRIVIATRDIAQGELVGQEKAILRNPPTKTKPLCLGCYRSLSTENHIRCQTCQWPMCSEECCLSPDHLLECSMHQKSGFQMHIPYEDIEPYYIAILPLRMLALKQSDPQKWQELIKLMSHLESWKIQEHFMVDHQLAVEFILDHFSIADITEDFILQLFGIAYVNDFLAVVKDVKIRLCCPKLAMLSHDCTPNVIRCTDESKSVIRCYASRPIQRGQKLSHSYIDLFLPSLIRRDLLLKSKHFICKCMKCQDPTELGTHGSSVRCSNCFQTLVNPPSWQCPQCNYITNGEKILFHCYQESQSLLQSVSKRTVQAYEDFITKYEGVLHPQNFLLIRVKYMLVSFYGRLKGFEVQDIARDRAMLERKKELGLEVLNVLEFSEPGFSSAKGVIFYELHCPYFIEGNLDGNMKCLEESVKHLEEAVRHLKFKNDENTFGHKLLISALSTLLKLKAVLGKKAEGHE